MVPEYRRDPDGIWVASHPQYRRDPNGFWVRDVTGRQIIHEDEIDGYQVRRYRPRVEGLFARIERWSKLDASDDVHWRSISRDNILTLYGFDENSRIADPLDSRRIFSWLICETRDDKGNAVLYRYKEEDGHGVDLGKASERNRRPVNDVRRTVNRYIKRIHYGNRTPLLDGSGQRPRFLDKPQIESQIGNADWMFEVVFDYGDHDAVVPKPNDDLEKDAAGALKYPWELRPDAFSSYRATFEVRTARTCQRVLMFHHFPGEEGVEQDCLVRSTDFTYSDEVDPADARNPVYTFLQAVTQTGYRRNGSGYDKRSLPPVEFEYSEPLVQDTVEQVDSHSLENLPIGLDGSSYRWTDLHGEGIPGILTEQAGAWFYKRNLSPIPVKDEDGHEQVKARFAPLETVALKPNVTLSGGAEFMDLAGDGQPDVAVLDGPMPGLYEHDEGEGWQPFRPFPSRLNRDLRDPNLKFIDLDGDGHADVLVSEDDAFVWHASLAEDGFEPARRVAQALDEEHGPRIVFADGTQSIYLADLSGDGLTDIVRIRNGEVCYWPNLGYGRFGAKVTMDNAPWFDNPDQFDHKRIRLADIDGSGTTDIIYLHRDGVCLYFNQSGNSWSAPKVLNVFPRIDDVVSIMPTDLLGNGTACLVWSSPLPGDARGQMRYVNLMGGRKPHLLLRTINNLGAETRVDYASSTRFYLQDKRDGKPWITRLPFPVQVVERVETFDHISRNRFVTRYAYHHGYFDGEEREFRGFGMVEQWDTEEIGVLENADAPAVNESTASYVPPMHTKTWFHTGAWRPSGRLTQAFKKEYWPGDPPDFDLQDTVFPTDSLSVDEEREACRVLRGSILRQEIYSDDAGEGSSVPEQEKAVRPYSVSERNYTVKLLQSRGANRHAVFFVHARETIDAHHERMDPPDPRITHQMVLKVDDFGNVEQTVSIGYGRTGKGVFDGGDNTQKEIWKACQEKTLLTFTQASFTNDLIAPLKPDVWRTPAPAEVSTFELTGPGWSDAKTILGFDHVLEALNTQPPVFKDLNYEDQPTPTVGQKRLVERVRTLYRKDDLTGLLPLGTLESLALPGESYKLAISPGLLGLIVPSTQPSVASLTTLLAARSSGYRDLDGDGNLWIPSGRVFFADDNSDPHIPEPSFAATERGFARQHFFLPQRFQDIFGESSVAVYDVHNLFPTQVTDAAGNSTSATYDYRVLQPCLMKDVNEKFTEAAFDILGLVAGTAILGKSEAGALGDTLKNFQADLTDAEIATFFDDANPRNAAPGLLGKATSRIIYDVDAFQRSFAANPTAPETWQSAFAATLTRERHVNDPAPDGKVPVQVSFSYSDGFGREMQKKIQAEDGPLVDGGRDMTPRWVGSGWTIFNNKGKPVRQYEPFFSATHRVEWGRKVGVSATLFYDPVGRVVATLHPNHTWEQVLFDPWKQETWDVNDTVGLDPRNDKELESLKVFLFHPDGSPRLPAEDYLPTWHELRTDRAQALEAKKRWPDPETLKAEKDAAEKAAVHAKTPTRTYFDTLGRPFLVITENHWFTGSGPAMTEHTEFAATQTIVDIEGQQLAVKDAMFRTVMAWDYDYLGRPLCQHGMDGGSRWMLADAANQPLRRWDERDHDFSYEYQDPLHRPTKYLLSTGGAPAICYERFTYGEPPPGAGAVAKAAAVAANLRGRLVEHRDTAGLVTNKPYDEKGNLLSTTREVCMDFQNTPDWNGIPALEPDSFTTSTAYDALGRPKLVTAPDGSVTTPEYNDANFLNSVTAKTPAVVANATTTAFPATDHSVVTNIDYDEKGQRTRVDYGNGLHTEFDYDLETFRLLRIFTFKGADRAKPLQDLRYTYDPVGNITSLRDNAQPTFFFRNAVVEPHSAYTYDALYRLIEATGREHIGQNLPSNAWDSHRRGTFDGSCQFTPFPLPGDGQAMRNYTQLYEYDSVGNFKQLRHVANGASWTRTYAYNELSLIQSDPPGTRNNRLTSTTVGASTETYTHDAHGSIIQMPHLPVMETDFRDQLSKTQRQVITCAADRPASNGEVTWYVYDSGGERVRKVTTKGNNRLSERLYLGAWETYQEYDATDTKDLERHTLHVNDGQKRIVLIETRTFGTDDSTQQLDRLQFTNHLGTATMEAELATASRTISYEEYHPYGTSAYQCMNAVIKSVAKRHRYTGKERDEATGLYYHSARYYMPWLCQWASIDPGEEKVALSRFGYVCGNPIALRDPNGQWDVPAWLPGADRFNKARDNFYEQHEYATEFTKALLRDSSMGLVPTLEDFGVLQKPSDNLTSKQARNDAEPVAAIVGLLGSINGGGTGSSPQFATNGTGRPGTVDPVVIASPVTLAPPIVGGARSKESEEKSRAPLLNAIQKEEEPKTNNPKGRTSDSAQSGSGGLERPSSTGKDSEAFTHEPWKTSDTPGEREVSYKNHGEVRHGSKDSTRPDVVVRDLELAIEVKNRDVSSPKARGALVRNIVKQSLSRAEKLPASFRQALVLDTRGQDVSDQNLQSIVDEVNAKTNNAFDDRWWIYRK